MLFSYTNRHGKEHYFREVLTKKGKYRYYVTTSDQYPNLIEEVPSGFEVTELPEDAKVVIRRIKPVLTSYEEREILQDAIRYYGHTFHPVGEIDLIEEVAIKYGQHLGKVSFFDIEPNDLK